MFWKHKSRLVVMFRYTINSNANHKKQQHSNDRKRELCGATWVHPDQPREGKLKRSDLVFTWRHLMKENPSTAGLSGTTFWVAPNLRRFSSAFRQNLDSSLFPIIHASMSCIPEWKLGCWLSSGWHPFGWSKRLLSTFSPPLSLLLKAPRSLSILSCKSLKLAKDTPIHFAA